MFEIKSIKNAGATRLYDIFGIDETGNAHLIGFSESKEKAEERADEIRQIDGVSNDFVEIRIEE